MQEGGRKLLFIRNEAFHPVDPVFQCLMLRPRKHHVRDAHAGQVQLEDPLRLLHLRLISHRICEIRKQQEERADQPLHFFSFEEPARPRCIR